ncbi:MAG: amidase family protein, partial [Actinomycetota bacterium]|nr:amidase family protein [Actinomycetota bacterium]
MTGSVVDFSAVEQRAMLEAGQVSARELLDAHLGRIEEVNPTLNAVVALNADVGRARAALVDDARARGEALGPLAGLVTAHKDLSDTVDFPTTFGSPLFATNQPKADSLLVSRVKAAGAVAIGKTNTPEFGRGSHTFNMVYGITRNPYDPTRTAGGSSGGAAVALSAHMVAIADGSDMGGSLRNPAGWTNVVGFRASPGVVPSVAPGPPWPRLGTEGAMGRTVDDLALLLSVISAPHAPDPLSHGLAGLDLTQPI